MWYRGTCQHQLTQTITCNSLGRKVPANFFKSNLNTRARLIWWRDCWILFITLKQIYPWEKGGNNKSIFIFHKTLPSAPSECHWQSWLWLSCRWQVVFPALRFVFNISKLWEETGELSWLLVFPVRHWAPVLVNWWGVWEDPGDSQVLQLSLSAPVPGWVTTSDNKRFYSKL